MRRIALVIASFLFAFTSFSCQGEEDPPEATIRNTIQYENMIFFDLRVTDVEEAVQELEVRLLEDGAEVVTIKKMLHLHETTEDLYFYNLATEKPYTIEVVMTWHEDGRTITETVDTYDFTIKRIRDEPTASISNIRPAHDSVTFDFLLTDPDGAVTGLSVVLYDEEDEKLFELHPPEDDVGLGENEDVVFFGLDPSKTYTIRVIVDDFDGYKTHQWVMLAEETFETESD